MAHLLSARASLQRLGRFLLPLALGVFAFWLYASTAAPWLTWGHDGADGGDLIAAAMTWGVPHPSGYPTYILLARLYALLPLGNIARRFNLFSAACAAVTVALVYLVALRLFERRPACKPPWPNLLAMLAALACAGGSTLWSQATIAEVYTLNALFFILCIYLALHVERRQSPWTWAILGLVMGWGLGNHLTLGLALPGIVLLLDLRAGRRRWLALALGLSLGLGVYLYLLLAARGSSPVLWGQRPNGSWGGNWNSTWAGFWGLVSGKLYHGYLLALPLSDLPSRLAAWAQLWGQQYSWLGVALSLLGLYSCIERGPRRWALASGITFLFYTFYALAYNTTDSYVYLIPGFLLSALWLAEGAGFVLAATGDVLSALHWLTARPVALRACLLVLLLLIPARCIVCSYRALNLRADGEVAHWLAQVYRELPQGAVLITGDDRHTFALEYAQWVEGRRPDLLVADGELLTQPWYVARLRERLPALSTSGRTLSPAEFATTLGPQRTIYLDLPRADVAQVFVLSPRGLLWRVLALR